MRVAVSIKINKEQALQVLLEEAEIAKGDNISQEWLDIVEEFSRVCESTPKTHIAFLGTALLAKAVDLNADVFSLKAGDTSQGAYSARGLGHGVLVPNSTQLGINLGVTGREPLNNQPYFREKRVSREMPVHPSSKEVISHLCSVLEKLAAVSTTEQAREALRAFIKVRRNYQPQYLKEVTVNSQIAVSKLVSNVCDFVYQNSEGGKRAQAVTAGLMDYFFGFDRVETSRINDPDRHIPGDVAIKDESGSSYVKVFEVRDKPVALSDLYFFSSKSLEASVSSASVLSIAKTQEVLDYLEVMEWSEARNLSLFVFFDWKDFVEQVLFWSEKPPLEGASEIAQKIYERAVELEVSEQGAAYWLSLFE